MAEPREENPEELKIGSIYVHFKGEDKRYRPLAIARDCEDSSRKLVVYEQLYDTQEFSRGTIWTRSLEDFTGFKEIDGKKIKRFILVEE